MNEIHSYGKTVVEMEINLSGKQNTISILSRRACHFILHTSIHKRAWLRPVSALMPPLDCEPFLIVGFQFETGFLLAYKK